MWLLHLTLLLFVTTTVFVYSIYEQMFVGLRVGRASAEALVFFAVLLALTGLELAFHRRRQAW